MIEPDTATAAASLLSTAIGEMVEDEHDEMIRIPPSREVALARAVRLRTLGGDVAVLAQAMTVLLTRSAAEGA